MKGTSVQPTVRWNTIYNIADGALAGNNDTLYGGEYYHNLIYNITGSAPNNRAMRVNQNGGMYLPFYYYRNTIIGKIQVRDGLDTNLPGIDWTGLSDTDVGPFYFTDNVIVNSAYTGTALSSITYDGIQNGGGVIMTTNLQGVAADGITTATGALSTGTYHDTYYGLRGYEYSTGEVVASARRHRRVHFIARRRRNKRV